MAGILDLITFIPPKLHSIMSLYSINDESIIHKHIICFQVSESKVKYINKNYAKVNAKMYDFTCDIKLKVGTETFRAHKEVLSEVSMLIFQINGI